jgi:dTMP kinase
MYPDMTLIIDVPAEVGMRRAKKRSGTGGTLDRFEREEMATHEMRREGFLDLAKEDPVRCRIIDGDRDVNAIFQDVFETVELALPAILPKKARGKRFSKNKVS